MRLELLTFGIARDIAGGTVLSVELNGNPTVEELKRYLIERFPTFASLTSLQIAVNAEFATNDLVLHERDEIALIPPVSGG